MACGCDLDDVFKIPEGAQLDLVPGKALRAYANAHNVSQSGPSAQGFSKWRNGANSTDLRLALVAHRDNKPLVTPNGVQGVEGIQHLPALLDKVEQMLTTVNPELVDMLIAARVEEEVKKYRTTLQQIAITVNENIETIVESQHKEFKRLLRTMATGVNVMLVGPAGSGKTEAAMAAAKALDRKFEIISVGPQTMQSELAGYKNAHGSYVTSALRRAYESGDVLIIDEIDAGNAGVFTFTNASLSNSFAGYPDGPATRHPAFQVIACANTYGTGADMVYVGRSQLDGATLDRYATLIWDYDHDFEMHLALQHNSDAKSWVLQVQRWRIAMMKHKIRHIISPRASIYGAKLLKVGFSVDECAQMLVFKGLNKEAKDKILQTTQI